MARSPICLGEQVPVIKGEQASLNIVSKTGVKRKTAGTKNAESGAVLARGRALLLCSCPQDAGVALTGTLPTQEKEVQRA
jgi:hypothetical protein